MKVPSFCSKYGELFEKPLYKRLSPPFFIPFFVTFDNSPKAVFFPSFALARAPI